MYFKKPEPGDVFRFNGNNAYLYFGKYKEGHLYILVAQSHMPVSDSIVKNSVLKAYHESIARWGELHSFPKIFVNKVHHVDFSEYENFLDIWRLHREET